MDSSDIARVLTDFENTIDLYNPEGGGFGCRIIDFGEVSVVLSLGKLPGLVLKRMSGFKNDTETEEYINLEQRYIELLKERGITPIETSFHPVQGKTRVVYLVQKQCEKELLGHYILRTASMETVSRMIEQVLDRVINCIRYNRKSGGIEAAVDSQLSNWYFPPDGSGPVIIDLGSPIMRINGKVDAFTAPLYRSGPAPLTFIFRLLKMAENYFNDYFDIRLVILDMLGNFYKEGAPERIPECVEIINRWLARQPEHRDIKPVTAAEVESYYRKDVILLEHLLQRMRRIKRFSDNKIFRRQYDFILPGKIKRR